MLAQRVVTAVVLLAVLLGARFASSPWPLVALLIVMAACALWEWLRLTWPGQTRPDQSSSGPLIAAAIIAAGLIAIAAQWLNAAPAQWSLNLKDLFNYWLLPGVALIWIIVATALVIQGRTTDRSNTAPLSVFAALAVVSAWAALVELFLAYGAWFLLSFLALIWFADIAAYSAGRAFGKHKLAPRVSPGKTWEGAVGGVLAGTVWVLASSFVSGSFGAVLKQAWPLWAVIAIAAFLTALSIVGDLFESLLKRRAGVKDSSQLLPGHGGVYDRIDALLPVAPIALLLTGVLS
jgi:phosphatidate cytidylyltransferase